MNIHHRQSEADNVPEPTPGWVAGGPNPGNQSQDCGVGAYNSSLPALSYLDDYCSYSTNEITTYWNSPFIYLAAALESSTPDYTHNTSQTISISGLKPDSLYDAGTEIALEWTATEVSSIDIYYKIFSDDEFTEVATGVDASSGKYEGFEVPDVKGDSLIFRIEETSNSENWDQSPVIKITPGKAVTGISIDTPNGNEPGKRLYLGWNTFLVDSVDLYYRFADQEEPTLIEAGLEPNEDFYFRFSIPENPPNDSLYIRIQDSDDPTLFRESEPLLISISVGNEDEILIPNTFELKQNYPNPFNPTTQIEFSLADGSFTKLEVFDASGRLIRTLVEGMKSAGKHTVSFDASQLASGVYIYKIQSEGFTSTKKMLLIK
jgi:hypothetical protein